MSKLPVKGEARDKEEIKRGDLESREDVPCEPLTPIQGAKSV
jgi:hypothetical protein